MMKGFVQGVDRHQATLLPECLDDWVDESNPVRAVDVFVDEEAGITVTLPKPQTSEAKSFRARIGSETYAGRAMNRGTNGWPRFMRSIRISLRMPLALS